MVDVCGLWFGITIGELKTKERRGGVRGKSGRGGMGGDGWHDSDIVQLLYVQFLTHKGRQDL